MPVAKFFARNLALVIGLIWADVKRCSLPPLLMTWNAGAFGIGRQVAYNGFALKTAEKQT